MAYGFDDNKTKVDIDAAIAAAIGSVRQPKLIYHYDNPDTRNSNLIQFLNNVIGYIPFDEYGSDERDNYFIILNRPRRYTALRVVPRRITYFPMAYKETNSLFRRATFTQTTTASANAYGDVSGDVDILTLIADTRGSGVRSHTIAFSNSPLTGGVSDSTEYNYFEWSWAELYKVEME